MTKYFQILAVMSQKISKIQTKSGIRYLLVYAQAIRKKFQLEYL